MALQLNEPRVDYKAFPGEGTGRIIDQMPKLIAEGRTPLSVRGLMKKRLEVADYKNEAVRDSWLLNYFDTGDAVLYHPDGRIKIVLDYQLARELNPKSRLKNGALMLPDGAYEGADCPEFKIDDLAKYGMYEWLKRKKVSNHPIWKALAGDDKLLDAYGDMIFRKGKEIYNHDTVMGVFLADAQDVPTMRLWYAVRLGWSGAGGSLRLDGGDGRLVGVAPEAHVTQNLEGRLEFLQGGKAVKLDGVTYVKPNGGAFKYNGRIYVPVDDKNVALSE